MAHFVRLASEKPALLGVGSQSSNPTGQQHARSLSQDQAILEANSVAGIISADSGVTEVTAPGVSVKWSSMKTPCLEQLDKADAPVIPDTYIYSLVLTCLNNLSENAAKVVLPLTISQPVRTGSRSRGASIAGENSSSNPPSSELSAMERLRVANPLELVDHPAHATVVTMAHLIDSCWPAILATSSTFLNAALDAEFYRGLIRSVQRFTQIAGLLRLSTPRDAFLTTLTKSAVPAHLVKTDLQAQTPQTPSITSPRAVSGSDGFFNSAKAEPPSPLKSPGRNTLTEEGLSQAMSQRNLMCLRALINLAIALGSILGDSWKIVVESLQKADNVLAQSSSAMAREYKSAIHSADHASGDQNGEQTSLTNEIVAVEAAVTRLFQSTVEYPNEAFLHVLKALFELISEEHLSTQTRTLHFALAKIGELVRLNVKRLALEDLNWGWTYLIDRTRNVATALGNDSTGRLMAADIMSSVALGVSLATVNEETEVRGRVQIRAIESLENEVTALYDLLTASGYSPSGVDMDVHRSAVEAVRSILETCGDSLISGWRSTFSIVESAFVQQRSYSNGKDHSDAPPKPISTRIAKSAFACVQLICSDFLASLKPSRIVMLIDIFSQFCFQTADMNLSLTTLSLFWNLSDFLQSRIHAISDRMPLPDGDVLPEGHGSDLDEETRAAAEQGSPPAIWMILLDQLAAVTSDRRGDVRIGAVQTVFRIIGSSAERFDARMWTFVLKRIIFKMVQINLKAYPAIFSNARSDPAGLRALHATTETLLRSWAMALVTQAKSILQLPTFEELWAIYLEHLAAYLDFKDDTLTTLAFDSLSRIIGSFGDSEALSDKSMDAVLALWMRKGPSTARDEEAPSMDETSLIAYIQAFKSTYPHMVSRLELDQVRSIASNIQACVITAQLPQYTTDVDSMTTLQVHVLECFSLLWKDIPKLQSVLVRQLAYFIELPLRVSHSTERGAATYVAFAKGATNTLGSSFQTTTISADTYSSGALSAIFKALALVVGQRYSYLKQGKEPSLWRSAATASIRVMSKTLPSIDDFRFADDILENIFSEVVQIANHLRETNLDLLPADDALTEDESFDLDTLVEWRKWTGIRLTDERLESTQQGYSMLNEHSVSLSVRGRYVKSLFLASLFHETNFKFPADFSASVNKVRTGRVHDPPFHPRVRICYASLDELFAIADADLNPGKTTTPLAAVASPYLTLRCSLPLQRYIADQPLRGKMPTPTSQRLELLYILGLMRDLGKALRPLIPLVHRALAPARRDPEVADALQNVMEAAFASG